MNERKETPNILWLVVDHIAFRQYRDFFKRKYKLQAFERLAAEGVEFEKTHSVCPLCCPARASMVTGLYPHNHGITQNGKTSKRQELLEETPVFGEAMRKQGYRTAYFGKWHVGDFKHAQDYGFEGMSLTSYGKPYLTPEYAEYLKRDNLPDPKVHMEWTVGFKDNKDFNMREVKRYVGQDPSGYHMMSTGVYEGPAEVDESFFVADMACRWLQYERDDQPFLMRVDTWGPHQPYHVGAPFAGMVPPQSIEEFPNYGFNYIDRPEFHQKFRNRCIGNSGLSSWDEWRQVMARVYEHMLQTDAAIGKILDTLDKEKLTDNTVVILTADHGDIAGIAGGLFDKGAMMVEETMQIPLVVRWPGVTAPGMKTQAHVTNMDIVPTVLELAGAEMEGLDGTSFLTILKEQSSQWRDDVMCEHHGHGGDVFQRVLYWKQYKYVAHLAERHELYDLQSDPYELYNRIDDFSMVEVLKEMKKRLLENMSRYGDISSESQKLIDEIKG